MDFLQKIQTNTSGCTTSTDCKNQGVKFPACINKQCFSLGTGGVCKTSADCGVTGNPNQICFSGQCQCPRGFALSTDTKFCSALPCDPSYAPFGLCTTATDQCYGGTCFSQECSQYTGDCITCQPLKPSATYSGVTATTGSCPLGICGPTDPSCAQCTNSTNGQCPVGKVCQSTTADGKTSYACVPVGPVCSDSVPCGTCPTGYQCEAGTCMKKPACVPDCTGYTCGKDPVCGQPCGTCDPPNVCKNGKTCEPPGDAGCLGSNCGTAPDGSKCGFLGQNGAAGGCPPNTTCSQDTGGSFPYQCVVNLGSLGSAKDLLDNILTPVGCPNYLNFTEWKSGAVCYKHAVTETITGVDGTSYPIGHGIIPSVASGNVIAFDAAAISGTMGGFVGGNYGNLPNQTNLQILFAATPDEMAIMTPEVCNNSAVYSACASLGGGLPCQTGASPVMLSSGWLKTPFTTKNGKTFNPYFSIWGCAHKAVCAPGWAPSIVQVKSGTDEKYVYGCARVPKPTSGGDMCKWKATVPISSECHTTGCGDDANMNPIYYSVRCHQGSDPTDCTKTHLTDIWGTNVGNIPSGYLYPSTSGDIVRCTTSTSGTGVQGCPTSSMQTNWLSNDDVAQRTWAADD